MPGLLLPVVAWGAPEDISAAPWAGFPSPLVTGGQVDPFGGTGAVLVEDDDAVSPEFRYRILAGLPSGTHVVVAMAKQGTGTTARYHLQDETLTATRFGFIHTWATAATSVLGGTLVGKADIGGGWVLFVGLAPGVVGASQNSIRVYGAGAASADMGSTYWYLRNAVLLDFIDDDKPFDSPPPGAARVRAPSGIVDRWIPGGRRDYRLKGVMRWIPSAPRATPVLVSGWDGLNQYAGVNCGVRSMLRAGQEGNELLWVPDRSNCAVNIPSDLVEPFDKEPYDWEDSGDRKVSIELVNTTTIYPSVL